MNFTQWMEAVTKLFELLGVGVILAGLLMATFQALVLISRGQGHLAYERVRATFGRSILLNNLFVLGLLVIIRTFLSWSLEVEIDGRWPWQAAKAKQATTPEPPARS
jgi:uncharacterized membrane protein